MIMRWLLVLTLTLGACHAQSFIFPDEWEKMQQQWQGGGFRPEFEGTDESVPITNEVQGELPVFGQGPSKPSSAPEFEPKSPADRKSPSQSIATFLPPKWRDHVLNIISNGIAQFTLDMDYAIENSTSAESNENILFSPASLAVTLAMVLLASGGKTFEEVSKILGLESGVDISHHSEIVHQILGLLLQESDNGQLVDPNLPQAKFAFALFVQDDYPIREEFRTVSEKVYNSDVINLDFARHSREAQTTINDWVSKRTNGKISNMLSEAPSPLTEIIITSALYFSGEWDQHFVDGATSRREFTIEPDQKVYVDMMANGGDFPFYEDKELDLKIIGLPYKGGEVTMYAVLPNAPGRAALRKAKRQLTPQIVDALIDKMENKSCLIGFPRMKLSSTLKLQGALEALGLKSLFDPQQADLSVLSSGRRGAAKRHARSAYSRTGSQAQPNLPNYHSYNSDGYKVEKWNTGFRINQERPIDQGFVDFIESLNLPSFGVDDLRNSAGLSNPGLYADDVIHRVEMTINEKGTEAAAATSIILNRSGDYKKFRANRPFFFFIRHDPSRSILFWGSINRPTPFFNSM